MASVASRYEVAPLRDGLPFGATVSGLTLDMLKDESTRKALYDLWIDKGVLYFRDGDSSDDMHMELSACFGPLEEHLFPSVRSETNPALTKIKLFPGKLFLAQSLPFG